MMMYNSSRMEFDIFIYPVVKETTHYAAFQAEATRQHPTTSWDDITIK
jgi:hypothetical protein